eukprot:TRINITY_DN2639_c0_g1_i1.p2 TRINITY_DN2639_c0_g1~~TRINITY_DN2639_c0_g1_i1.p2  ORF type:complete len:65 (+),score=17.23 TRINITY_DN2639_c0_g1_i1:1431-1625(+)
MFASLGAVSTSNNIHIFSLNDGDFEFKWDDLLIFTMTKNERNFEGDNLKQYNVKLYKSKNFFVV